MAPADGSAAFCRFWHRSQWRAAARSRRGLAAFLLEKGAARAWKTPPREIALARIARAQMLGMTYREYTAVLLDRGVHL